MSLVTFTVPGVPVPKLRAKHRRVTPKDGSKPFVQSYTPKKTVLYEDAVAWACKAAMRGRPMLTGALSMEIQLYLPIPKSWPKRKQAEALAGRVYATSKPDSLNVAKAIEDALNEVLYADDAAIVSSTVMKRYSDQPRAVVTVGVLP